MSPAIKITAIVLLVSLMLHTGLQVDRERLRAVLRNYALLLRAFVANFIIVPLLGLAIVRLFQLDRDIAIGVMLMAISPGVPFVVFAGGRAKGGALSLAVSLAFLMPALSVITVPITAHLMLPSVAVSAKSVVLSLVLFQLVPLLAGMFVNERAPTLAARLKRIAAIIALVSVVAILGLFAPRIVGAVTAVYGSRGMYAMLSLIIASLLIGWLFGGRQREFRRTLGIGTALRNVGLAMVISSTTFAATRVNAAVVTYLVIQIIVSALIGVYFKRTISA